MRPALAATALAMCAWVAAAQELSFEVASVKPHPWTGQGSIGVFVSGNTLHAQHVCLDDLVEFAWNLRSDQLSGGPAWTHHGVLATADLYEVIAKGAGEEPLTRDKASLMLRSLLAERFGLQVKKGSKIFPVYRLEPFRGAPKLAASAPDTPFSMHVDARVNGGRVVRITAQHTALEKLVPHIGFAAGRPTFDKTGAPGFYDLTLEYAPEDERGRLTDAVEDPGAPPLPRALQNQLGLTLVPDMAPFETIVIEHAEKPTAN